MRELIARHLDDLSPTAPGVDRVRLLAAIAVVESNGGHDLQPNFEPAFWAGGPFYRPEVGQRWMWGADPELKICVGKLAASSWGPWQVMYPVAVELGYDGTPWGLSVPEVNINYAIRYLNQRALPLITEASELGFVGQVADAYNSGSCKDANVPTLYISKVIKAYMDPNLFDRLIVL